MSSQEVITAGNKHNFVALIPEYNRRFNRRNNAILDDLTTYLLRPIFPDLTQEIITRDGRGNPERHISIPDDTADDVCFMLTTDEENNFSVHVDMTQENARALAEEGDGLKEFKAFRDADHWGSPAGTEPPILLDVTLRVDREWAIAVTYVCPYAPPGTQPKKYMIFSTKHSENLFYFLDRFLDAQEVLMNTGRQFRDDPDEFKRQHDISKFRREHEIRERKRKADGISELESKANEIRESASGKPGVLAKRGKPALPELNLRANSGNAYYRDVKWPQKRGPGTPSTGHSYMEPSKPRPTLGQGNVATGSPVF
jgi:hypothetical protein